MGNGWFGGGVPLIATALVTGLGSGENSVDYQGLLYPIGIALMTTVIGFIPLKETHHIRIWDEVSGAQPATADAPAQVIDVTDPAPARERTLATAPNPRGPAGRALGRPALLPAHPCGGLGRPARPSEGPSGGT